MECKNCGEALHGNYCSACGQKIITERITLRHIFSELVNIITNVDRGFLYTIKMLFVAPGEMIRNYLNGQTRRYYHPLRYLFFLIAISVGINLSLGLYDRQQSEIQSMVGGQRSEKVIAIQQRMNEQIKKYLNFIPVAMIPVLALFSFLFFRKKHYNYAEHLVVQSFLQGQFAVIGIPVIVAGAFLPNHYTMPVFLLMLLMGFVYGTYVFKDFFQVSILQALIKYLLTFIISYLIIIILGSIVMTVYLIISGNIR